MADIVTSPASRFLHVMCKKCKNEQVMYNKIANTVVCTQCGEVIAEPQGGDAFVKAKILENLG